jgi:hypothetical protein
MLSEVRKKFKILGCMKMKQMKKNHGYLFTLFTALFLCASMAQAVNDSMYTCRGNADSAVNVIRPPMSQAYKDSSVTDIEIAWSVALDGKLGYQLPLNPVALVWIGQGGYRTMTFENGPTALIFEKIAGTSNFRLSKLTKDTSGSKALGPGDDGYWSLSYFGKEDKAGPNLDKYVWIFNGKAQEIVSKKQFYFKDLVLFCTSDSPENFFTEDMLLKQSPIAEKNGIRLNWINNGTGYMSAKGAKKPVSQELLNSAMTGLFYDDEVTNFTYGRLVSGIEPDKLYVLPKPIIVRNPNNSFCSFTLAYKSIPSAIPRTIEWKKGGDGNIMINPDGTGWKTPPSATTPGSYNFKYEDTKKLGQDTKAAYYIEVDVNDTAKSAVVEYQKTGGSSKSNTSIQNIDCNVQPLDKSSSGEVKTGN